MSYSIKQASELANKIEAKYSLNKQVVKKANNVNAIQALMSNYEGTFAFLKAVAEADMYMWKDMIESGGEEDAEAHNDERAAASQCHKIIMDAANAIHAIESKFW